MFVFSRSLASQATCSEAGVMWPGVLGLLLLSVFVSEVYAAPPDKMIRAGDDRVQDEYIVVLQDDVLPEQVPQKVQELAGAYHAQVEKVWSHVIRGFFAEMSEANAEALSHSPFVKYVEENARWYLSASHKTNIDPITCDPTTTNCPTVVDNRLWHLDRGDQNAAAPTSSYSYCTDGTGVTVYVVDTGVNKFHQEFASSGRVQPGFNASGDLMPADDPCMGFALAPVEPYDYLEVDFYRDEVFINSHGTAVASALGGTRVGIAKNVTIVPVKVRRCDRTSARARISGRYYEQNETMFRSPNGASAGQLYRATNSGYTAGTDPGNWPTSAGSTKLDNEVTWVVGTPAEWQNPGTTQMLIDGLEWIMLSSNPGPKSHAVVTLSTYRRSDVAGVAGPTGTVEAAIRILLANNITVIASANNQNGNACDTSPGRLSINNPDPAVRNDVITVGGSMPLNRPWGVDLSDVPGTDVYEADGGGVKGVEPAYVQTQGVRDARWICGAGDSSISCSNATPTSTADPAGPGGPYTVFQGGSNAGPCVTLFAPAKNLFVASTASVNAYRDARLRGGHASGTSWSAPISAGFAARVLQANPPPYTPAQVRAKLLENSGADLDAATLNTYAYSSTGTGPEITGTPNKLLHLGDVNVVASPASTPAALSGPTTLTVAAGSTSGSALSYQWYEVNAGFDIATYKTGAFSSALIPGATTSTFAAPAAAGPKAYWVRVTNSCGSADTTIAVVVPRPAVPTGVIAVANPGGTITVSWSAAAGAESYEVQRKIAGQPWTAAGTVPGSLLTFTETPPTIPGGMVVYRVRSIAGVSYLPPGNLSYSTPSNNDFVNLNSASYEPLAAPPAYTLVKAQHVTELRAAVNALCLAVGVAAPYTAAELQVSALQGTTIRAADFTSLMTRINAIRTDLLLAVGTASFAEEPAVGTAIKRLHIADLRNALE